MGELPWYEALLFGVSVTPFCWTLEYYRHEGTLQLGVGPFRIYFGWK